MKYFNIKKALAGWQNIRYSQPAFRRKILLSRLKILSHKFSPMLLYT